MPLDRGWAVVLVLALLEVLITAPTRGEGGPGGSGGPGVMRHGKLGEDWGISKKTATSKTPSKTGSFFNKMKRENSC